MKTIILSINMLLGLALAGVSLVYITWTSGIDQVMFALTFAVGAGMAIACGLDVDVERARR